MSFLFHSTTDRQVVLSNEQAGAFLLWYISGNMMTSTYASSILNASGAAIVPAIECDV